MRTIIFIIRALGASLGLFFLCSCAAQPHSPLAETSELPADTMINPDAGRGGHLIVPLRLDAGRELLFMVDTGAPVTLLDKSLMPNLGRKKSTQSISLVGGGQETADVYAAPKLYWGNTRLKTGRYVSVIDFKKLSFLKKSSVVGILGMDCLRYYCMQLDFEAGKIRFLSPQLEEANDLGRALPLAFTRGFCPQVEAGNFVGSVTNLMIDIGCNVDGMVDKTAMAGLAIFFLKCNWEGEAYTNVIVAGVGHANALGLRFLARHKVTFDFPKSTLYLQKRQVGPLAGDHSLQGSHYGNLEAPLDFLLALKAKNQLPDWSSEEQSQICFETCSNSLPKRANTVTFSIPGRRQATVNHYETAMEANGNQWKLQRAWQTDGGGKTIEEFPVP